MRNIEERLDLTKGEASRREIAELIARLRGSLKGLMSIQSSPDPTTPEEKINRQRIEKAIWDFVEDLGIGLTGMEVRLFEMCPKCEVKFNHVEIWDLDDGSGPLCPGCREKVKKDTRRMKVVTEVKDVIRESSERLQIITEEDLNDGFIEDETPSTDRIPLSTEPPPGAATIDGQVTIHLQWGSVSGASWCNPICNGEITSDERVANCQGCFNERARFEAQKDRESR